MDDTQKPADPASAPTSDMGGGMPSTTTGDSGSMPSTPAPVAGDMGGDQPADSPAPMGGGDQSTTGDMPAPTPPATPMGEQKPEDTNSSGDSSMGGGM